MDELVSFGAWIKRRRKALDLTQAELAERVGCSIGTIRHIEADERRPSKQLAELLADQLAIPPQHRAAFLQAARAELGVDRLTIPPAPVASLADRPGHATDEPELPARAARLPSGTVTFLFTDIEGSTRLWEQHKQAMPDALARHDTIVRAAIEAHGGVVFRTVGDAFCAAFARATDALGAALAAQRALHTEPWGPTGPLRVRMALHTGVVERGGEDYLGLPLSRVARLLSVGHGEQVLLSLATHELVREQLPPDTELRALGEHRLKDLTHPEQIFQLLAPDLPSDFPPLRTLDRQRTNLPVQPTALIGREAEVRTVVELLGRADVRLITLTGPGGIGKTRLSLQVAAEVQDDFADGVWFVNLAPISDPNLVATTIAQTLGVKESSSQPLLQILNAYLHTKHMLLVLDNFEQLLDAAPLIAELLAAARHLKVLATSRAVLHLSGEREFGVSPLGLPDPAHMPPLEQLTQYDAVRLFIERAQAVKPDFAVTNANAPAVAEICYRLDGLPLAIELAAVRVKLFSPEALLKRLERRLLLLTGGMRDLPARQQTLRAAIDWSHHLLDEAEQALFRRLAVFVGGCTLEAAEVVCNVEGDLGGDVLDGLAALVDKSLLRQEEGLDGAPRFVMLETIREYALDRLDVDGETETLRQGHASYYLALAETAEPALKGREQRAWLDRLEHELDNFRAALKWGLEQRAVEATARLSTALCLFWELRDHLREGMGWLDVALTQRDVLPPAMCAKVLYVIGRLNLHLGSYGWAQVFFTESLALFRTLEDTYSIASVLTDLGWVMSITGAAPQQVSPLLEESLALFRALGNIYGIAWALDGLGWAAKYQGDDAHAAALFTESLALRREIKDQWGIAWSLNNLGWVAIEKQDYATARAFNEERLAVERELNHKQGIAASLYALGLITLLEGNYQQAPLFFEQGLTIGLEVGDAATIASAIGRLGDVARLQRNYGQAIARYNDSLAHFREIDDKAGSGTVLYYLGYTAHLQGDNAQAVAHLAEGLALAREADNKVTSAFCLVGFLFIAAAHGQLERAARLYGAAEALMNVADNLEPDEHTEYDRTVGFIRAQQDPTTFAAAWAEGQAMTLEQAIAYALGEDAGGTESQQTRQVFKAT